MWSLELVKLPSAPISNGLNYSILRLEYRDEQDWLTISVNAEEREANLMSLTDRQGRVVFCVI